MADFNGDGHMDLLQSGRLTGRDLIQTNIHQNRGLVEANEQVLYEFINQLNVVAPVWHSDAAWADLDGDSDLDLVLTGATNAEAPFVGGTFLYRNDGVDASSGRPLFQEVPASLPHVYSGKVAMADVDNDGDLDLAITGFTADPSTGTPTALTHLYIKDNAFIGGFRLAQELLPVGFSTLVWEDYDQDQDQDLLVTGVFNNSTFAAALYRNDDGVLVDTGIDLGGIGFGDVGWADYDEDGDPDLLMVGSDRFGPRLTETNALLYRNDDGQLTRVPTDMLGGATVGGAWTELNGDGRPDIFVSGLVTGIAGQATLGFQNNFGTFERSAILIPGPPPSTIPFPGLSFGDVAWGDYNADNDLDFLIAGRDGSGEYYVDLLASSLPPNISNSPPLSPSGLRATVDGNTVVLAWNAGLDGETSPLAMTYNVRVGRTPGGDEVMAAMAATGPGSEDRRMVNQRGNVGQNVRWRLTLPAGTYFWAVQALDASNIASPFSNTGTFTIP